MKNKQFWLTRIKIFLVEAIAGFILWTLALTPYMLWVVKTTNDQYIAWLGMQAILVPIIAPFVFRITAWILKKIFGDAI